jgi:hypothetical protein
MFNKQFDVVGRFLLLKRQDRLDLIDGCNHVRLGS